MELKNSVQRAADRIRDSLIELSHDIHAHPELGYEEHHAAATLNTFLSASGFEVTPSFCEIPTAFKATFGAGPLHIAFCAEYDALPGIGHACGHNIIAATSVGAAVALAAVTSQAGVTVSVIGTPAEEVGNDAGKVRLLERGGFNGIHAAMMIHPAPFDVIRPRLIAASLLEVEYTGKEAHASAFPELGINAGDALTIAQVAIGLLRQHLQPMDRIHGIVTRGGDAPNIIPAHTAARYIIRSGSVEGLRELHGKVKGCFEAGAIATGSTLTLRGGDKPYAEVIHDPTLSALYENNARALGREITDFGAGADRYAASTDMGNVSLRIPSIHPFIGINSLPAANHQPEFTRHCITADADRAVYDGVVALAWTALDAAADKELASRLIGSTARS